MSMVRCKWVRYNESYGIDYETECGKQWHASHATGDVKDHGYLFCPFCGKEIKEVKDEH